MRDGPELTTAQREAFYLKLQKDAEARAQYDIAYRGQIRDRLIKEKLKASRVKRKKAKKHRSNQK